MKLAEAPSHGKPCVIYDEECIGSEAYKDLALEILDLKEAVAEENATDDTKYSVMEDNQ